MDFSVHYGDLLFLQAFSQILVGLADFFHEALTSRRDQNVMGS